MMLSIILVAFCLRIIITGVGPLLPEITKSLGLSGSASGLLTTLPLIAFAVVSPLTGGIGRRLGEGRTVLIGLCLILLGTVLRSTAGILGLFLGTAIVGVGTAIGNVLLPAVVKAEYPTRVGQVTAYFTVAMVAAAAIGLALNVPLSTAGLGWNGALMIWGIAVVITGFIWRKNVSLRLGTTDPAEAASDPKPIWKSGLAWCVTLYFGINSLIFYAVIGWLPTILQSSGMAGQTAGMVTSLYQVVSLAPSLLVPTLAGKRRDQRGWLLLGSILNIIGITTLMASSAAAAQVAATIILGLANGCAFSMGLALMGFRAKNAVDAARLSGFAQSVGYALAATGPLVVGWLHDLTPNWNIGLGYILFTCMVALLACATPILCFSAVAAVSSWGTGALNNAGAHGLSEILYAFTSGAQNNGSAFAGLSANVPVWNVLLALAMFIGRFGVMLSMLVVAGSLAARKKRPISDSSFPVEGPTFGLLLLGIIFIVGALTYLPALFAGAFLAHHRYVKRAVIAEIYAQLPNKGDMLGKLVEMYSEPIVALMDDPEAEGNASWTVDWLANRRPIKRGAIPPSTLTRKSSMRFFLITLQ